LKVRSRHRLAALTGRSGRAYEFWVSCREPHIRRAAPVGEPADIVVVIDCRATADKLDLTMGSIGSAKAVIIGQGSDGAMGEASRLREALSGAKWLCPIACGDVLADGALEAYSAAMAEQPEAEILYGDDDILTAAGRREAPHFKPDWNPELFRHHDYLSGACIFRCTGAISEEEFREWPLRSLASLIDDGAVPLHIPLILHHRRQRAAPIVPAKPANLDLLPKPTVTVIIPTRNQVQLLQTCIAGVGGTHYPRVDVIVIDNDSDDLATLSYLELLRNEGVEVLRGPGPFNYSALNNHAVSHARGEILLFLNNDIEIVDPDWLSLLAMHAVKEDIGAVGAQLLYPDGTIQHAGVYTGIGGGAGHAHRYLAADAPGYFDRPRLPQRVSAVTGACLAVSRAKFLAVGGFDEEQFPVAFNDVDLCLKLNTAGWQSFYEPRARLIHHESKSRGSDRLRANRDRFAGELAALKAKWRTDVEADPFHHPHLSPFCEEFFVAI
jgi:GT2 family glycosyltransferase